MWTGLNNNYRILLLNNKPELAVQLQKYLLQKFEVADCIHNTDQAIQELRSGKYGLLVLSNHLNDMEGVDFLKLLKKESLSIPCIVLAGDGDIKQAVSAMKEGAEDFIQWSDDQEALFPYIEEVLKKLIARMEKDSLLAEGELLYKTLFENIRDAVYLHFLDEETLLPGPFIEVNKVACRRMGYTKEEFMTMGPQDIDVPGQVDVQAIADELLGKGSVIFKTKSLTKDGREIPTEVNARLFDFKGRKAILSVARNITTQQKILDDLRNSEKRFRAIIDKCIIGICITDEQGVFEFVNDAFCQIYGYSPEEIVGQYISMVVLEEKKSLLFDRHKEFFKSKSSKKDDWDVVDKFGRIKHVVTDSTLIIDAEGRKRRVTFVEDVTEERKSKQALEMSEVKYRTMMENLQDPVFISDSDFEIVYANNAFNKRFGAFDPEGKCHDIIFGIKSPCSWCMAAKENMSRFRKRQEKTIKNRDYQITTVPINYNGHEGAKMTILRDVTKVVKARRKAEESDRLKSAFLANISHEIRTPLNAMLGFSNLLKDDNVSSQEADMYIDMINESGNHLMHVMDDIIEFSFIDSGLVEVHPVDLNMDKLLKNLDNEAQSMREKMSKGYLEVRVNNLLPQDLTLKTDESRLRQILLNLISNAVKFTEQGEVNVSVRYTKNKWVVISVKDTGIGIPREKHNVIFKRFRQVDEGNARMFGGNGLGLALCKHLAEMLGGHIKFESETGKGSDFQLFIPATFDESMARAVAVDFVK
ncbi:PAS domain S-box protein [Marinilabilia rubra]|uniref:histidine kinase n=1 Tax=Marinilabilia rubra TaxID=2162893 RepID=A0A2U2B7Y4_9BACT|nr:PAS domain S-box protein [Marinilabilia rubra]PWD99154.1 histidine kinase [Marinilabilia rubra]